MRLAGILAGVCCLLASVTSPLAQPWPARPITMVVGFAPGGSTDVVARLISPKLGEKLGTSVIIENRPGASSIIAQTSVAQARPDGYTFLFGSGSMASNVSLRKDLPFDAVNDFVAVTQVTNIPAIVCVNDSFPASNLKEFISYVKTNPGKVNYGSAGSGTFQHVAGALFEKLIGGQMVHVPYRGGAPANTDLAAGRVQVVFGPVVELAPFVQSGRVRVLGVTTPGQSVVYPDASSVAELVPTYEISTWHAVLAPKGTPPEIVGRMQQAMAEVINEPDIKARLIEQGLEPIGSKPQEFRDFLVREIQRWKDLIALAGVQPD